MMGLKAELKFFLFTMFSFFVSTTAYGTIYQFEPDYNNNTPGMQIQGLNSTLASQILNGEKGEEFFVEMEPRKEFELNPLYKDGSKHPGKRSNRKFHLRLQGKSANHLVVIIPGFGGTHEDGAGLFLSDLIYRNNKRNRELNKRCRATPCPDGTMLSEEYIVLVSNSPAAPEFVRESHSTGYPGVQKWDALDLYDMIYASIQKLESDDRYKEDIKKVSIVGASLGSMNTTHMMAIDFERKELYDQELKKGTKESEARKKSQYIGFYKVFAINPPISNTYGSTAIDDMVRFSHEGGAGTSWYDHLRGTKIPALVNAVWSLVRRKYDVKEGNWFGGVKEHSEKFMADVKERVEQEVCDEMMKEGATDCETLSANKLTRLQEKFRYLVGFGFGPTVTEAIEAMLERRDTPESEADPVLYFTDFLRKYTYQTNYVENQGHDPIGETDDSFGYGEKNYHYVFTERESVGVVVKDLQAKEYDLSHYHLITWHDDFLLRASDPEWIRTNLPASGVDDKQSSVEQKKLGNSLVFEKDKDGAIIHGGHLGGYWQEAFQDYLLKNLL